MRPSPLLAPSCALALALAVTGCGREDGTAAAVPCAAPSAESRPELLHQDGVRITGDDCDAGASRSAAYTVENSGSVAMTYTITFTIRTDSGEVWSTVDQTVPSVAPGAAVRRTVTSEDPKASRIRIEKVRAVPADQARAAGGACPSTGWRIDAGEPEAAMGLRALALTLVNCSQEVRSVSGYPRLQLLDAARDPVAGVRILDGTNEISTGLRGADVRPGTLRLAPGEAAAATVAWRNTTDAGPPAVNAPYLVVRVTADSPGVVFTPEVDLGTTGRVGVSPWFRKADPER